MDKKVCIVVGAGDFSETQIEKDENNLIIAADGGLLNLEKIGVTPDIVVGDFDSLGYVPKYENIITLNRDKDITDTWAGIEEGIKRGYKIFKIYGGTGGRESHTLANIQNLIKLTKMGYCGEIISENEVITAVENGEITFDKNEKGFISVFAYSHRAEGVFLKNLKYELDGATLTNTEPLGVSNEFIGKEAKAQVKNGIILIVYNRKRD
ncbi:MAG: thiamine diphosphokinase [Clostridia bacterium]|nr:thiamine diphosphokinase [Clostridia bacterium]